MNSKIGILSCVLLLLLRVTENPFASMVEKVHIWFNTIVEMISIELIISEPMNFDPTDDKYLDKVLNPWAKNISKPLLCFLCDHQGLSLCDFVVVAFRNPYYYFVFIVQMKNVFDCFFLQQHLEPICLYLQKYITVTRWIITVSKRNL